MAFAKIDRLSLRFSSSIAVLVLCVQAGSFFFVYQYASRRILEASRSQAQGTTEVVHMALEDAMLKKDDRLLRKMVDGFAKEPDVERVMILDRDGSVRFTSDPSVSRVRFDRGSPTCQICHQAPPDQRALSTMLEVDGGRTLRVVDPIPNQVSCHDCHDANQRINGLVIVDMKLDASLDRLRATLIHLATASSLFGIVLFVGTGMVFRQVLAKRLQRFERTARAISQGDLSQRIAVRGDDALASLENQFNGMAESVSGLLERLRRQQADLEKVMNSVDDGIAVLDVHRKIVAANEAFSHRLRDPQSTPIGRSCCLDHGAGGLGCEGGDFCPTATCFQTGTVQTAIKRRSLADGSMRYEEVRASPVFDESNRVEHVVEVWRDITDRRSAEAKLAETQRMVTLGMLASGFSHEVNTPMGSIGMCLDGIRRLHKDDAANDEAAQSRIAEYLKIASMQVQRVGTITEQFLRLSSGKTLTKSALDLLKTTDTVLGMCRHRAKSARVELIVEPAENLPSVAANESAVQQVVLNLLLNAVDASAEGSAVRIGFACLDDEVHLRVIDQGYGIEPEHISRLFEPFFSKREGGTGLGLFVSMNLAQGWGGDIRVESRKGKGSTFTLVFPRTNGRHANGAH